MREVMNFRCNSIASTGNANYHGTTTSAMATNIYDIKIVDDISMVENRDEIGKYSVFEIADWFLSKGIMTQKKLQKLCYYAQAWSYALNNIRLMNTDFQAWVHGPVSPALYERFKGFGYDAIKIKGEYESKIDEIDAELLEDIWKTYGDRTGNALEALTHRELPWIEARKGYANNERCTVVISPKTMKEYYSSIYAGK